MKRSIWSFWPVWILVGLVLSVGGFTTWNVTDSARQGKADAALHESYRCGLARKARTQLDLTSLKAYGYKLRGYDAEAADAREAEACK